MCVFHTIVCLHFALLLVGFHERRENEKIDKLTEDLYDASCAIHCNEQMLREIKHNSRDQRKEMAQVCMYTHYAAAFGVGVP